MEGRGQLVRPGLVPGRDQVDAALQDREALHLVGLQVAKAGNGAPAFRQERRAPPDGPVIVRAEIDAAHQVVAESVEIGTAELRRTDIVAKKVAGKLPFPEPLQEVAELFLDFEGAFLEEAAVDEFGAGHADCPRSEAMERSRRRRGQDRDVQDARPSPAPACGVRWRSLV